MNYWINLKVLEPSAPYYEVKGYSVRCSWDYKKLMGHLPCDWVSNWYGRQAKELIKPIKLSLDMLESYPMRYEKYLAEPERSLRTMDGCHEMLLICLEYFEETPDLLINVG